MGLKILSGRDGETRPTGSARVTRRGLKVDNRAGNADATPVDARVASLAGEVRKERACRRLGL